MRFLQKPHFEEFDEIAQKKNTEFSSQIQKKQKKFATFAKNVYFCTR